MTKVHFPVNKCRVVDARSLGSRQLNFFFIKSTALPFFDYGATSFPKSKIYLRRSPSFRISPSAMSYMKKDWLHKISKRLSLMLKSFTTSITDLDSNWNTFSSWGIRIKSFCRKSCFSSENMHISFFYVHVIRESVFGS